MFGTYKYSYNLENTRATSKCNHESFRGVRGLATMGFEAVNRDEMAGFSGVWAEGGGSLGKVGAVLGANSQFPL